MNGIQTQAKKGLRLVLWIAITVICANSCFYGFHGTRLLTSPLRINGHVIQAFQAKDLIGQDWPLNDSLRGIDQFSDAYLMYQLQLRIEPRYQTIFLVPGFNASDGSMCVTLEKYSYSLRHKIVEGQPLPSTSIFLHRFWEGPLPVSAILLDGLELSQIRLIFKSLAYLGFALLGMAAIWVSRESLITFMPIVVFGFLFSGIPYLGQSLVHMGFTIGLFTMAATMVFVNAKLTLRRLVLAFTLAGAVGVYFDQLNGTLLQMLSLALPTAYYVVHRARLARETTMKDYFCVAIAAFSLVAGAFLSYMLKLGLLSMMFGYGNTFGLAMAEINHRMNSDVSVHRMLDALFSRLGVLTYGHSMLGMRLVIICAVAWIISTLPLIKNIRNVGRKRTSEYTRIYCLHFITAIIVISWYFCFRNHTIHHPWLMGRYLYIPLSLGWANLLWLAGWRIKSRPGTIFSFS